MSTPRRRIEALEVHTAGHAVDRYITYVTHVDGLTEAEAHTLRAAVATPAGPGRRWQSSSMMPRSSIRQPALIATGIARR